MLLGRKIVEYGGILGISIFYTIVVALIAIYFVLAILEGYKARKKQAENLEENGENK